MENVIFKKGRFIMGKVICGICLNQTGGFCSFKKSKVKLKKRRVCDKFRKDTEKIGIKQAISTTRRPDWHWWTKQERKNYIANAIAEARKKADSKNVEMLRTKDAQHPLTGNLDRFRTTAADENKEKE
jgi:hypothetical protein